MSFTLAAAVLAATVVQPWPAELDAYIEKARAEAEVPGLSVTVVRAGQLVVAKGYGVRTLGKPERIDENTMFDIASVSKSFTAAAIATLVDEGKIRWDDPIRRYLPHVEFSDAYRTANVTFRDLLSHRLGLDPANSLFRVSGYSTDEVLRRVRFLEEREPFRGSMIYSNVGYTIAGEAAAAAAGMTFTELVRTRITEPLGMTGSTVGVPHSASPNFASPHANIAGVERPIDHTKQLMILPANAINSTPRDIAKWMLFQLGDGTWNGKTIVSKASMDEMQSPQVVVPTTREMRAARGLDYFAAYGLGWQVWDYHGHKLVWHSGSADGMPVYMALLPDDEIGVMVMVNSWSSGTMHGAIAAKILDTLLGRTDTRDYAAEALASQRRAVTRFLDERAAVEKKRVATAKPSRALDAYAGTYVSRVYGDMTVTMENGALRLQFGRGELADLTPWHFDTFRVAWRDRVYEAFDTFAMFALDAEGMPRRLEMRVNRDVIEAVRK